MNPDVGIIHDIIMTSLYDVIVKHLNGGGRGDTNPPSTPPQNEGHCLVTCLLVPCSFCSLHW